MRFGVLGPLAVWTSAGRPVRVPEAKVRLVLAELLVHEGRPVSADRLAEDLWGDRLPANPAASLQVRVSQLRRALEEAEPGGRGLVVRQAPGYLLRVPPDAVDAGRFAALTARAHQAGDPRERAGLLSDALALWRGPALADFADEPFAAPAIARLEERRLTALEERAAARLALGEHVLLTAELADLVAAHPLRERLRGAHMLALYRAGRQSEALDGFHELRRLLTGELGLDPGPDLLALHEAILRQDPALRAPEPVRLRTNLPAPATGLVGRDEAVTVVGELLRESRLVTLHGSGGVGKTRLALEVAARRDGAWLVELTALKAPASLAQVTELVAAILGMRDDSLAPSAVGDDTGSPAILGARGDTGFPAGRLAVALRGQRAVLLLDNCEHVVEPVAELAGALLAAVPDLRILATSQEPLGVVGERVWTVPPLDLPDPTDPASAARSSAVRLFVDRAAAAGHTVGDGDTEAVAAICRRLDGIPLALELAATRTRVLGVRDLAERLDDRFRVLETGRRSGPARQRTLRAMIDWSWDLLTAAERVVLRRLAVHAEGCTLEAAEQVCAGEGVRPGEVLGLLARLVDRSLVVLQGTRYRLLESVAAYCAERLTEAAETDLVRLRHASYHAALAERADLLLRGPDQRDWLARLDAESANTRAALETATRYGRRDLALRLVNAMSWYWFLRGRLTEARRSVTTALAIPGGTEALRPDEEAVRTAVARAWRVGLAMLTGDAAGAAEESAAALESFEGLDAPAERARALWLLGFAQWGFGVAAVADERVRRALAAFEELGDRWGQAAALSTRARAAMAGDFEALRRDGEHADRLFRELGDRWGRLRATEGLALLAEATGDYPQAARLHREALRGAEDLGLWTEVSYRLSALGRIALLTGALAQATELHERAGRLAAEQANEAALEFAEVGLGLVARRRGRFEEAEERLRPWVDWWRRVDGAPGLAFVLAEFGFAAEQRGDGTTALARHEEGLAAARATGHVRSVALALEGLAGARAVLGEHERAAGLLGEAAALRESVGAPLPEGERGDVTRITASIRTALDEQTFTTSYAQGLGSRQH